MMTWISQKHKNLDISRAKHYFFFKLKRFINYNIKGYFMTKNSFVAEVTFKEYQNICDVFFTKIIAIHKEQNGICISRK